MKNNRGERIIRTWFQNLNDDGRHLFHFRGSVSHNRRVIQYSVCSGPALRFEITHGEAGDDCSSTQLSLGLLFFSLWLTIPLPKSWYFQKKCVATWDGGREFMLVEGRVYGFYFYHWSFVWHFHAKRLESSSTDPWWMHQYWHLDEWILGKVERVERELLSSGALHFKLGGKDFVMDKVVWTESKRFRTYIPFALYHQKSVYVKMDISKPPMRAGKGENSWDCGDDGCFGMSAPWPHSRPGYLSRKGNERQAISDYVGHVLKDAARYGGSSSERGILKSDKFEFIGAVPSEKMGSEDSELN